MLAGLGATMAQGMAFGAGSAVAHKAVDAIMGGGSRHEAPAPVQQQAPAPQVASVFSIISFSNLHST